MFSSIISYLMLAFGKMGYIGIMLLMAFESTVIPIPSELIIPPAAYLANKGEFNLFLIIIFATIGNMIGASIMYFISRSLGRIIIYKLANTKISHALLINEEKIQKTEKYFIKNGELSVFIGRLIPVVRHLISIPAGLSKMKFYKFILFTFCGSITWNIILSLLGYYFGANEKLLMNYFSEIKIILLAGFSLFIIYLFVKYLIKRHKK